MHSTLCFSEHSVNQVLSQKQQMFCTFCFFYIHSELETLNTIRKSKCRTNKLLTDRTKKVNQSIFCYLHMYANNTYRYFSTVLRRAPKKFSTRQKPIPFLKNRTRFRLSLPIPTLKIRHLSVRRQVALGNPRGKTCVPHISAS